MRKRYIIVLALLMFLINTMEAQFIPVIVEKGQTIYSLSRSYNIPANLIIKDNPRLERGLKAGDTIYVREIQAEHIVKWFESLNSIARKYGVTENEILEINDIKDNTVKTRQVLRIPYGGMGSDLLSGAVESQFREKEPAAEKKVLSYPDYTSISKVPGGRYTVSMILPLGGRDSVDIRGASGNFIEFYQGFLIALEDLKHEFANIKLELRIFDSDKDAVGTITNRGFIDGSDMIIGPVFARQLEPVLSYSYPMNIPVISPVDPAGEEFSEIYPNFFHVSTPHSFQQRGLISNINRFSQVLLVWEKGVDENDLLKSTSDLLKEAQIDYNSLSYNILEGRSILPRFEEQLRKDRINHIVVASNSEAFVSDVLRNLNLLQTRGGYPVTIYGTPRWRNFESVDIDHYHKMNLNISLQYYVDYGNDNVKRFLSRFRALYGTEPSPYAFQAYDVAYYFLGALFNFGKDFRNYIGNYNRQLLQSDYNFMRRTGEAGYVNIGIRQLIYRPDYSITVRGFNP